jgi:hypothetical protein
MGHFAFEKLQMRSRFSPEVVASVETQLGSDLATILPDDVSWIIGTVLNWLEELFCDLFAIWLIGPCFSFSYIELFDLGYVLPPAPGGNALQFYDEHPADVLRLQQHRIMLEHLGWWNGFSTISSQHILLLNQCSSLKKNDFEIVGPRLPPIKDAARDTFFDVIPVVHSEVHSLFSKIDSGVREFNELAGVVEQYLWRGVVPSSVFHENRLLLMHPSATTLLNAAARVHISSMDELLERVADADPLLPKDRAHWTSRLELWTMKALEDSVIFERTGQGWR